MTDHSALIERLEAYAHPLEEVGMTYVRHALAEAAAALREMGEQKPFAHFQWNEGWRSWEQVVDEAAGQPRVVAAYRFPLPSSPNQAKEAGE
ncbi:hypothetical protein [Brevundimonas bullata]